MIENGRTMTLPMSGGLPPGLDMANAMRAAMGEMIHDIMVEVIDEKFGDIFDLLKILAEHPLMRKLATNAGNG